MKGMQIRRGMLADRAQVIMEIRPDLRVDPAAVFIMEILQDKQADLEPDLHGMIIPAEWIIRPDHLAEEEQILEILPAFWVVQAQDHVGRTIRIKLIILPAHLEEKDRIGKILLGLTEKLGPDLHGRIIPIQLIIPPDHSEEPERIGSKEMNKAGQVNSNIT